MTYKVLRERAGHVTLLLLLVLQLQLLGQQRLQRRLVDVVVVMVVVVMAVVVMVVMVMTVVVMIAKRRVHRLRCTPAAATTTNPVPFPPLRSQPRHTSQL